MGQGRLLGDGRHCGPSADFVIRATGSLPRDGRVFRLYSAFAAYRILYLKDLFKGARPKAADWLAAVVTVLSSFLCSSAPSKPPGLEIAHGYTPTRTPEKSGVSPEKSYCWRQQVQSQENFQKASRTSRQGQLRWPILSLPRLSRPTPACCPQKALVLPPKKERHPAKIALIWSDLS